MRGCFFASCSVLILASCGDGSTAPDSVADASADASGDSGLSGPVYPAAHAPLPRVVSSGGPILASPKITAVTFQGDLLADKIETFMGALGGSGYWKTVVSEYGVGAATATTPVRVASAAPSSLVDAQVKAWIASHLDGSDPAWPAPDETSSVYVILVPETVTVSEFGRTVCKQVGGYHANANTVERPSRTRSSGSAQSSQPG